MMGTPFALLATFLLAVGANGQEVTTLAGSDVTGSSDDTGADATFNYPSGITYSPDGTTVLVADSFNHKIRKIDVASEAVTTLAGSGVWGSADDTGAAATFNYPSGITYSPDGTTVLVADSFNHKIRKIDVASEAVTTMAGSGVSGSADGTGTAATFDSPSGITFSPDGTTALVADASNHKIRKIDVASGAVTTLAGSGVGGSADGIGAAATFNYPSGITYSPDGTTVLVADSSNHKIRKIDVASKWVTTLAGPRGVISGPGSADGTGAAATFYFPAGITYSPDGTTALVADSSNHKIREIHVASKAVTTLAGSGVAGSADGTGAVSYAAATFNYPDGITYSPDGTTVLVADSYNHKIRKIDVAPGAKSSSAPTVAASVVGMIVSALVTATFN